LLYDNGQFSVEVPFRFPQFVNPLPKVFMKKEKIQLTVNSHPLKVIKYLLLFSGTRKTSVTYNYSTASYCNFQEKSRKGDKLSFLHEAAVENWSTKDFTFTYTVSYPTPFLDYLYLFDIFVYACVLCQSCICDHSNIKA
jgi:hypothetical protein